MMLLNLILVTAFTAANAQTRIGFQAGLNLSNVLVKDQNGQQTDSRSMAGTRLGVTVDIPVIRNFYLRPAVMYVQKGFKQAIGGWYGSADNFKVKANYVELPVNFVYKPKLAAGRLLLGAGPYIGYGTGGTWKAENVILLGDIMTDSSGEAIFKNDIMDGEFGSYIYGRPWDYGLNFLVGYTFPGNFSVQANIQTGLANLLPKIGGNKLDGSLRNNGWGFTVGYQF